MLDGTALAARCRSSIPTSFFSASFLDRSASYERFLAIDGVLTSVVLIAVLIVYARRGQRLVRESAAGRVGTGMLLAMIGFAVVWLAEAPFGLAALWWERRHDVSHQGYLAWLLDSFLSLGSVFVFVCAAVAIAMGLAGVMRRWWWLAAAPVFVALALLFTFVSPYLVPDTSTVHDPSLRAEARALERIEGTGEARLEVQNVKRFTDAPNAMSTGFGPTKTVILWDTLLHGGFSHDQVRFVMAHEVAHLAHDDPLKQVGWLALFLIPALGLVAFFTRHRGGLAQPEAVPVALLVFVALQVVAAPALNAVTRRQEAAADWAALQATRGSGGRPRGDAPAGDEEPQRPRSAELDVRALRRPPDDHAADRDGRSVGGSALARMAAGIFAHGDSRDLGRPVAPVNATSSNSPSAVEMRMPPKKAFLVRVSSEPGASNR